MRSSSVTDHRWLAGRPWMSSVRPPRQTPLLMVWCLVLLLAVGCAGAERNGAPATGDAPVAGDGDAGEPPDGERGGQPSLGGDLDLPSVLPNVQGFPSFREACARLDDQLSTANVVYDPHIEMVRGDSATVRAAVTLDVDVPPDRLLETPDAVADRVVVSCAVEAQLVGAEDEFEIRDPGWQMQRFTTQRTARWTWFVLARRGGVHELVLRVRPVVHVSEDFALPDRGMTLAELPVGSDGTIAPYEIVVDVAVPLHQRLVEFFDASTVGLTRARNMVVALGALALAVIVMTRRVRRSVGGRKRDTRPTDGASDGDGEPDVASTGERDTPSAQHQPDGQRDFADR